MRKSGAGDKAYKDAPYTEVVAISLIMNSTAMLIDPADIIECYFIEDILSPMLTGKIVFNDRRGMVEYGPITGSEVIVIQYGLDETRTLPFPVQKIDFMQSGGSQTATQSTVTMYFADTLFEYFNMRKYSRSFSDLTASEIVRHILAYMMKGPKLGRWEDSDTKFTNFAIPYWNVANTLRWIGKRARSSRTDNSGFIYYHNTEQGFRANWITLDKLFMETKDHKEEKDLYVFGEQNELYKNTILEWWSEGIDRFFMRNIKGGSYLGYKFNGKEFLKRDYTYNGSIEKTTIMGRKSLFRNETDPRVKYQLTGLQTEDDIDSVYYGNWFQKYNMQQVINIIVKGFETRYAGMQIEVEWPNTFDSGVANNKMMKGNYLVKSITHQFAGSQSNTPWRQRLVLLKNGYEDIDHDELVKATKTNVAGKVNKQ